MAENCGADALDEISAMLDKLSTDDEEEEADGEDAFETVDDETLYDVKRTVACLQQEGVHVCSGRSHDATTR